MAKFTISNKQLFLFLFILQTGTVFISFQSRVINAAEQNAWIVFVIVSGLHLLLLILFDKYYKYFKMNKFEKWLYQLYWYSIVVIFLTYIDFVLKLWAFPLTPAFIVISLMAIISLYANLSKYAVIFNISVILIPFIFVFFAMLSLSTKDLTWTNFFPIGEIELKQWMEGFGKTIYAFIGIEAYLILRPFVQDKKQITYRKIALYQLIFTLFFVITIIYSLLFFSLKEIQIIPVTIMYLLKSQEITFLQRLDLFFTYIWMTWSVISITLFMFLGLHLYKTMYTRSIKFTVFIHIVVSILPAFFITREMVKKLHDGLLYTHLFFGILFPLFIMLRGWRKSLREKNS
ncbi:GerAB/ArcD/ProY family transporter [Psychrobacillus vulpis]|uniref:Spore gernimation protein n=1 Tax=Psychrobacillus vulpis TaxID=2325572 RepID=A0A544TTA2_9BACI|nr:GerAB/ArcD/ProY family transporter [Psychrobacillus vulpis]TQR20687.1 spore gernimation protein [Psychrobacillus vulpis]